MRDVCWRYCPCLYFKCELVARILYKGRDFIFLSSYKSEIVPGAWQRQCNKEDRAVCQIFGWHQSSFDESQKKVRNSLSALLMWSGPWVAVGRRGGSSLFLGVCSSLRCFVYMDPAHCLHECEIFCQIKFVGPAPSSCSLPANTASSRVCARGSSKAKRPEE